MTDSSRVPVDAVPGDAEGTSESFVDYFAFEDDVRHYLPDGRQYVTIKVMTEGDRKKYQKQTSRPLRFDQRTNQAIMQATLAEDRTTLLELAITDWYLMRNGEPYPFNKNNLTKFLDATNPKLIDEIEKAVRKANPWMLADLTADQLREEITNLQEMLEQVEERDRSEKA